MRGRWRSSVYPDGVLHAWSVPVNRRIYGSFLPNFGVALPRELGGSERQHDRNRAVFPPSVTAESTTAVAYGWHKRWPLRSTLRKTTVKTDNAETQPIPAVTGPAADALSREIERPGRAPV